MENENLAFFSARHVLREARGINTIHDIETFYKLEKKRLIP